MNFSAITIEITRRETPGSPGATSPQTSALSGLGNRPAATGAGPRLKGARGASQRKTPPRVGGRLC